jgi:hypothetical protein
MAGSTSFFLKYRYAILLAVISFLGFRLWKAHVQRGVRSALCLRYVRNRSSNINLLNSRKFYALILDQKDQHFAAKYGCQPLKPWKSTWPFGLDLLIKAFDTIDPENIETILSKNFNGMW